MFAPAINISNRSFVGYASLVRLPNIFTAPPDVVVGIAIVSASGYSVSIFSAIGTAIASICLYAAGTTFNDYFDVSEDARFRPERPIPAGDVSKREAFLLGTTLLVGGVLLSFAVAGTTAGTVATCLAITILLYDGLFKGSVVGFLLMGANRGLNVLLGMAVAISPADLSATGLAVLAAVVVYIASVTFLGESETGESDATSVLVAILGTAYAATTVIGLLVIRSPSPVETLLTIGLLGGFLVWTGRALRAAYANPVPDTIGPAVGTCVLALVVLNAAFAATIDVVFAVSILLFLVPAMGLSGKFEIT